MKRSIIAGALLSIAWCMLSGIGVHADSLKIQPTIYRDIQLAKGEKKKAYVDISNPTGHTQTVVTKAQAFRQIDDEGALSFYDNEQIEAGMPLDLREFELGPQQAVRMYFLVDGTKLPQGDVFAAVLARTKSDTSGSQQSVQVGTLLLISNQTPSPHAARIASLDAPLWQFGDVVVSTVTVQNTAPSGQATGFSPEVTMELWPYSTQKVHAPLVFAGRTRAFEYRVPGNYFGFIGINASIGESKQTKMIFVATGYWRWLGPLVVLVGVIFVATVRRFYLERLGTKH